MLSIAALRAHAEDEDGWVVVRVSGEIVAATTSSRFSSPTLLVAPVTDALKVVSPSGLVEGSLDRDTTWRVSGFALDASTLAALEVDRVEARDLYTAVTDLGVRWAVLPAEDIL